MFEALKKGIEIPKTELQLYPEFEQAVRSEFERIKTRNFEEEFLPSRLIKYTVSGFDHILHSHSEEDEEGDYDSEDRSSSSESSGSEDDGVNSVEGFDDESDDDDEDDANHSGHKVDGREGLTVSKGKSS